jgi:hypothetical protein
VLVCSERKVLLTGCWWILREKYCWLVADKPNEQAVARRRVDLRAMLVASSVHDFFFWLLCANACFEFPLVSAGIRLREDGDAL